eukprot:1159268-Pleurochrysis_carterae.AAC.4
MAMIDRENRQMIEMLEKRIMKKLNPNDPRIRVFGELEPQKLMDLGLKVNSKRQLSRSSMNIGKFYEVFSEMAAAIFEMPISDEEKVMFIPKNIFKKNKEGVLILKPCNATHPMKGREADPSMDPWVKQLRSTYTEKEANDILEYLLEKYAEVQSQVQDDAGKAPRKLWDYADTNKKQPKGREMKPVQKFELLLELEEEEREKERQAVAEERERAREIVVAFAHEKLGAHAAARIQEELEKLQLQSK